MHQTIYEAIKRMIREGKSDGEICAALTRDYNVEPDEARSDVGKIRETAVEQEQLLREKTARRQELKSQAFSRMLYWAIGCLLGIFLIFMMDGNDAHRVAGMYMTNYCYYLKLGLYIFVTAGCGVMTLVKLIRFFSK